MHSELACMGKINITEMIYYCAVEISIIMYAINDIQKDKVLNDLNYEFSICHAC